MPSSTTSRAQAPKVQRWLGASPALDLPLHRPPPPGSTGSELLGQVEQAALKGDVFHSVVSLQTAINRFLPRTNDHPRPFCWTKDPDRSSPLSDEGTNAWILSNKLSPPRVGIYRLSVRRIRPRFCPSASSKGIERARQKAFRSAVSEPRSLAKTPTPSPEDHVTEAPDITPIVGD